MAKRTLLIIILVLIPLISCKQSSEPITHGKKLSEYQNKYKILVNEYPRRLFFINSDGTNLNEIFNYDYHLQDVTINEDFSKIAFSSTLDGIATNIYIMDFNGDGLHKLSNQPNKEDNLSPRFLPNEESIIYNSYGKLRKVNYDGSINQQITPDSILVPSHDFSVSACNIVFISNMTIANSFYAAIGVMNTDGSNLRYYYTDNLYYANPQISPDGTKICFKGSLDNNTEVYVMNIDGTNMINLSNHSSKDLKPGWLPDGSKIYFESNRDGSNHIYVINPDGTNLEKITKIPANYLFLPTWSPDLSRIAYSAMTKDEYTRDTIFIIDVETGEQIKLISGFVFQTPVWLYKLE